MKTDFTVLVTGMGALIGQGIAQGLKLESRARILGLDRRASGYGASLCDAYFLKPEFVETDPAYLSFWTDLLRNESVDLVLPGISADMYFLDANRDTLSAGGAQLGLNTSELISKTRDKLSFFHLLESHRLPRIASAQPETWDAAIDMLGPAPMFLKPRKGEGSQGQAILRNKEDFDYWTGKSGDNWLIQPLVGSDDAEYTVGAFGLGDGSFLETMIVMRRRLTRAGNTGYAEVVDEPAVRAASQELMSHFPARGPTNLQFRMDGDAPRLLEINPRFSSSCSLRTAFGFNEARMSVDHYLLDKRPDAGSVRKGFAERYSADHIEFE